MSAILLGALVATAGAAEPPAPVAPKPVPSAVVPSAAAEPVSALPASTRAVLRLADRARSHARWQESPWLALSTTAWGRDLLTTSEQQPGPFQLLNDLAGADHADLGIEVVGTVPLGHLLAGSARAADLGALLGARQAQVAATGNELRATLPLGPYRLDGIVRPGAPLPGLRWSWEELLPLPAPVLAEAAPPLADAALSWNARAPWAPAGAIGRADWTITRFGLREHARFTGLPAVAAGEAPAVADRGVFAGLPPDTIWAVASGRVPAVLARLPVPVAELDALVQGAGLGSWAQLAPHLGRALVWLQQGTPLPSLTIDVEMPQEAATAVLMLLDARHQFVADADGTHLGVIGFIPVHAGWLAGHLVITTSSAGIAGASARPGGFATQAEAASGLAELPPGDLLLAGVSRSGESWAAAAALAPWIARRRPGLVSLGNDLRKAGRFGFLALRRDGDALVLDAGGLCGGPLSAYAISGAFLRLSSIDRGGQLSPKVPPAPIPAPAPAPAPPANQIEF